MLHKQKPEQRLEIAGIEKYSPGVITDLLQRSYFSFYSQLPGVWEVEKKEFDEFDQQAFEYPDTVGRCVLFSSYAGQLAGMASFDPRQGPEVGIIGHNCVLPEFQGKGIGKLQIQAVLDEFRSRCFQKAVVSTGDHPFFLPAQRMYSACGFMEVRRGVPPLRSPESPIKMIEYERQVG